MRLLSASRGIGAWESLLLVAAVAWLGTIYMATGMGAMSPADVGLGFFALAWLLMMAAMMLPSVAPVAQAWMRMVSKEETERRRRVGRTTALLSGYLLAWLVVGIPAYALAVELDRLSMDHPAAHRLVAAVILVTAGVYQFTPVKRACLRHCRTPIANVLHYGGMTGRARDLRVGVRHGAYCAGCCWGLMAVLVLLGAMNLWLMAALTVVVFAEKIWRYGAQFAQAVGAILGLLGLAALVSVASL